MVERLWMVVLLAGCASNLPPALPGQEAPPCSLAAPHHYDGSFSGAEVLESGGLGVLGYFPDLDLLVHEDMKPILWPAHDHVAESLGNGYLFRAVEVAVREDTD